MSAPRCVACAVDLVPGFLPEATGGMFVATSWHPGEPTTAKETWVQRLASPGGVRFAREEVLAVEAWRCPACGRLDLFANRPPIRI